MLTLGFFKLYPKFEVHYDYYNVLETVSYLAELERNVIVSGDHFPGTSWG